MFATLCSVGMASGRRLKASQHVGPPPLIVAADQPSEDSGAMAPKPGSASIVRYASPRTSGAHLTMDHGGRVPRLPTAVALLSRFAYGRHLTVRRTLTVPVLEMTIMLDATLTRCNQNIQQLSANHL